MEQDQQITPQERARDLVDLLIPNWWDWWPTVWFAIRHAIVPFILLIGLLALISYPFGITLWDWAQLLIVPAVLAAGGVWFNRQQRERDIEVAERRAQDDAVQAYLDQLSELLLDDNDPLRKSEEGSEVRMLGRARTVTALRRLDDGHNRSILDFLGDARLMSDPNNPIIDLSGADLDSVKLNATNLMGAVLREANLSSAKLNSADLRGADLRGANLFDAELVGARLNGADLRGAKLRYADLRVADLTGTDLRGADLTGAIVEQE